MADKRNNSFTAPPSLSKLTQQEYADASNLYTLLAYGGDEKKSLASRLRAKTSANANRLADEMLRTHEGRVGGATPNHDMAMTAALGPAQGLGAMAGWSAAPLAMGLVTGLPDMPQTGLNNPGDTTVYGKSGKPVAGILGGKGPRMTPGQRAMLVPILAQMMARRAPGALDTLGKAAKPVADMLPAGVKEMLLKLAGEDTEHGLTTEKQALANVLLPSRVNLGGGR